MIVSILMAETSLHVRREVIFSGRHVVVTQGRLNIEVAEFTEFLRIMYHAYASLSRQSHGDAMRMRAVCEVGLVRFWVRPDGNGMRYGAM